MSKRAYTEPLDRNFEDIPEKSSILRNATEEEIKGRKIFTIKRPAAQEDQSNKPVTGFVFQRAEISGTTSEVQRADQINIKESKDEKPLFEVKPPIKENMFSGSIKIDSAKINTSLFFNNTQPNIELENKENINALNNQETEVELESKIKEHLETSTIIDKLEIINTVTKDEEKKENIESVEEKEIIAQAEKKEEQIQPKGLFGTGGFLTQTMNSSLFAPNPSPIQGAQPLLFNQTNQSSLFTPNLNPLQGTTTSLFGNVQSSLFGGQPSSNFGNNPQNSSIFSNVSSGFFNQTKKADEDEDEEGDDVQDEEIKEEEEEEVPENIEETLKNSSTSNTFFIKTCKNFKVGDSEALGTGFISIEQPKDNDKIFLLIFRNKTKRILHTSFIIPKFSHSVYMKGKKTAMTILTLGTSKDIETGVAPKLHAKIGFDIEDDATTLKAEFDRIFNMS